MGRNQIAKGAFGKLIKAEAIRFLQTRVKTPKARRALAEKMEVAPETIKDLLQRKNSRASYDLIFNALGAHLDLSEDKIRSFIDRVQSVVKFYSELESLTPDSPIDHQHPKIKNLLSEQPIDEKTRLYIMIVLEMMAASRK